jgi:hypothetical protein
VGSGGGSGGNKAFWVDQRVGLKVAQKDFGIRGPGGSDEAHRRFSFFEFWPFLRFTEVAASGVWCAFLVKTKFSG